MPDYLAIIYIGGGSSFGRSPDKEKAIRGALSALRDWRSLFEVSAIEVALNVYDVNGYDHVSWTHRGLIGTNEETGEDEPIDRPVEQVTRISPKLKKNA